MTKVDAQIIVAMADFDMKISQISRNLFMHRHTVHYHLDKVKQQTGLDARRFYDLVELLKIAQKALGGEIENDTRD